MSWDFWMILHVSCELSQWSRQRERETERREAEQDGVDMCMREN